MKSNDLELRFVCTDFPGPNSECVFVEVENDKGESVNAGEWRRREDGLVELVVIRHPAPTIVDLANADADGYQNGRASIVVELPELRGDSDADDIAGVGLVIPMFDCGYDEAIEECKAAIIAAGGTVRE